MKATQLLIDQNREVEALIERLKCGPSVPHAVLEELADHLAAQMVIERELFYPRVKELAPQRVNEGLEEHALTQFGLERLFATSVNDEDAFDARVRVLEEQIQHHAQEEETELYPKVEKAFPEGALDALGTAMKIRFDELRKVGFVGTAAQALAQASRIVRRTSSRTSI